VSSLEGDFFYSSAGRYRSTTKGDDVVHAGPYIDIVPAFGGVDRVFGFEAGDYVLIGYGETYSVEQVGADTVATLGAGGQVILVGLALADLPANWIQQQSPWDY
jgi:hypothetical protein